MIQANQLRIGNWIDLMGEYVKLGAINEEFIKHCHAPGINPIRLTAEILVKAGFESGEDGIYMKANICIRHFILSFAKVDFDSKGVRYFRTYITFVHQLQNLYFALTGEELPIDLTTLQ